MKTLPFLRIAAATVLLLLAFVSHAQDKPDHPLIPRVSGASVYQNASKTFFPFQLVTVPQNDYYNLTKPLAVEGKFFQNFYFVKGESSVYEVYTNYKNALADAETIFSCYGGDCGKYLWNVVIQRGGLIVPYLGEEIAYHAATFVKDGMKYHVEIIIGYGLSELGYQVTVMEQEDIQQEITIDGITKALADKGSLPFYGIQFDTGSDILKPSSQSEIQLIAGYLKANASAQLFVVGHTDMTGAYESNVALAQRRAAAVVAALTSQHGIAANRLQPVGVGPVAPIASNATEAGRAQNRRVEIVLK